MTELAAFVMALMLTVELGLAIAFGAAWLAHPGRPPGSAGEREYLDRLTAWIANHPDRRHGAIRLGRQSSGLMH